MRVELPAARVLVLHTGEPARAAWIESHLRPLFPSLEVVHGPAKEEMDRFGLLHPVAACHARAAAEMLLQEPFRPTLVLEDDVELVAAVPVDGWDLPDSADALYLGTSIHTVNPVTMEGGYMALRAPEGEALFRLYGMTAGHAVLYITRRYALQSYLASLRALGDPIAVRESWLAASMPRFNVFAPRVPPLALGPLADELERKLGSPDAWTSFEEETLVPEAREALPGLCTRLPEDRLLFGTAAAPGPPEETRAMAEEAGAEV